MAPTYEKNPKKHKVKKKYTKDTKIAFKPSGFEFDGKTLKQEAPNEEPVVQKNLLQIVHEVIGEQVLQLVRAIDDEQHLIVTSQTQKGFVSAVNQTKTSAKTKTPLGAGRGLVGVLYVLMKAVQRVTLLRNDAHLMNWIITKLEITVKLIE
jgi:hypothetical protein